MGGKKGKKSHGGHKGKGQSGGPREKKKTADPEDVPVVLKGKGGSTAPVHGLSNLGNTCFFNAVMQCIGQSHYFNARLKAHIQSPNFACQLKLPTNTTGSGDNEVCRSVTVQEKPGELTVKLNTFLSAMTEGGGGTLNPKSVFSEICRKAPRFSGYHQQDSQELLRYLLDSLRSEEVYRIKKALLLSYNVSSDKAKVTEEDRKEIKLYGIQAQLAETFVDDVFGGRLVSTVVCLECGNCSTIHETFLDLSLPIADDKGVNQQSSKRNKSGKRTAADSPSVASKESEREASPPLPAEKTLSKHQSKKAKKQQEKAAKKEAKLKAKKQQSLKLQEFLNTPSESNAENESEAKEGGEEVVDKMEKDESASQESKTKGGGETGVNNLVGGRETEGETTEGADSPSVASKESEREASSPLLAEKTLSKHQSKKAKKQQEKAAKKEVKLMAKKQQSLKLQEFLNTPSESNAENESEAKEGGEEGADKIEEDESASQESKTEGGGETSVNILVGGGETEGETTSQELAVEGGEKNTDDSANRNRPSSADNSEPADVSIFPSEDQNIDPATGECKVVAMDTEEQNSTAESTTQGDIFPDYASAGPLPDQRNTTRLLGDSETEPLASERREGEEVEENKKEDNEITELLGAITLNETESSSTTGVRKKEVGGGEMKREDNEPVNLAVGLDATYSDAALERLKVQVDSVEGSLKCFCTPELLTGSNKFACAVCTREKARKETTLEQEEGEGKRESREGQKGENGDMVNVGGKEGDERLAETDMEGRDQAKEVKIENDVEESTVADSIAATVDKTPSKAEEGSEVSQPPSSDEEDEHRPSSIDKQLPDEEQCVLPDEEHCVSSSTVNQLPSEEITGNVPGTQEKEELLLGDEKDELPLLGEKDSQGGKEKTSEKEQTKEEVVFSDAKKQFLIESLPLILTLNLKRFVQHGRRLQKNGRHISFPTLLDMAPFSTSSCKVGRCDSKGQLLYSLYGVVEHSGGMQGGHYTAYVRTRTPIKFSTNKTTAKAKDQQHQIIPSEEERLPEECRVDSAIGEVASESGASLAGGTDFDVSSSVGQWYYISDSRVRTATESEVLKSQAYLLFYEQLPLLPE